MKTWLYRSAVWAVILIIAEIGQMLICYCILFNVFGPKAATNRCSEGITCAIIGQLPVSVVLFLPRRYFRWQYVVVSAVVSNCIVSVLFGAYNLALCM